MQINAQNAKKIDAYIQDFPKCKLTYHERVRIQDKMTNLPVYRLPISLLFYNVENGRFAAEYLEKKKELGRDLSSDNPEDVKEIEKMLRGQSTSKTEWLKNNLKEVGQDEPGIITNEGYLVNGNRRRSVLALLEKEDTKYGFMNVGRLPPNVTESDIYKIELGKQLARDQKLDYGPINELLKIQHGLKSGMNEEQIAKTIGFSVEEIKDKIERLEMIKEYLQFIGEPDNFKAADKVNEHFIDLQNHIFSEKKRKKQEFSPLELFQIKQMAFSAIKGGIPHLDLRKIPKLVNNPKIKPIFLSAAQEAQKDPKKTIEVFEICSTRLLAEENRNKPAKILDAILGNLEALDLTDNELKKEDYKTPIKKIIAFLDNLKKLT